MFPVQFVWQHQMSFDIELSVAVLLLEKQLQDHQQLDHRNAVNFQGPQQLGAYICDWMGYSG